jgi:hypothetical protein
MRDGVLIRSNVKLYNPAAKPRTISPETLEKMRNARSARSGQPRKSRK